MLSKIEACYRILHRPFRATSPTDNNDQVQEDRIDETFAPGQLVLTLTMLDSDLPGLAHNRLVRITTGNTTLEFPPAHSHKNTYLLRPFFLTLYILAL